MVKVNAKYALKLMDQLVCELGGTTTRLLLYTHNGQPHCIVGHVLHRAGVPISILEKLDKFEVGNEITAIYRRSSLHEHVTLTLGAQVALATAQSFQDLGETWEHATRKAHEVVDRMAID